MGRMADIGLAMLEWAYGALSTSQALADGLGVALEDLPGRVWDSPPAHDADLPYVLLALSTEPRDVGGVDHQVEVMAVAELTAKVVGRAEAYEPIQPAAIAIHHALHGKTAVPLSGGGEMMSSRRLRSIAYPEQTDAVEYRHLGETLEVYAQ